MSSIGLSVSDIINVQISLQPVAAQQRSFGTLLILGDSGVIDPVSRYRVYTGTAGIAADFGSAAPEYLAAVEFFSQTPQPTSCYVGAWARTATSGQLIGATLSATQQSLTNFTNISSGGVNLVVDGTAYNLSAINLTGVTNLNGVASAIQSAFSGAATVFWDANNDRFVCTSATSGTGSSVAFATPGTGADLSELLGWASTSGGYVANGIAAETPVAAASILAGITSAWYGLQFACSTFPSDTQYQAVSKFIQDASPSRVFGVTTQESAALVAGNTTVAAILENNRTFVQYSSSSPYAAAAAFGIAFPTNFQGANTLYTLMFKQESGITPEVITETQAAVLKAEDCNVFVNYNNGSAILQYGVMSDGTYFDIIHGTDWLQNDLQTAVFNLLLQNRKIAQTDSGVNQVVTTVSNELVQAVTNGLVAPGVWTGPSFGAIVTGQTLSTGFYVYAPTVASQSAAARAARQSPTLTCAVILAGAIQNVPILVNVV